MPIYLDYNATTPIAPEVASEILPFITTHFGNPSSSHAYGLKAKAAVDTARKRVAEMIGAKPQEIVFTSCATESINLAIKGVAHAQLDSAVAEAGGRQYRIISVGTEHPATISVCESLRADPRFDVVFLGVGLDGLVSLDALRTALTPPKSESKVIVPVLVSVMLANNETGTIQPIAEWMKLIKSVDPKILIHIDASQAIGKIPVRITSSAVITTTADSKQSASVAAATDSNSCAGVDLLTMAGHKFYAPKGVGALYVREGVKLARQMHGASHESGRRAGTENVVLAVGLGRAAQLVTANLLKNTQKLKELRDRLQHGLIKRTYELASVRQPTLAYADLVVRVNGPSDDEKRLPNTLSISFRGVVSSLLLSAIDSEVAASGGAACHSDTKTSAADVKISSVLVASACSSAGLHWIGGRRSFVLIWCCDVCTAVGIPRDFAIGTLRLSVGLNTTTDEIDRAISVIATAAVERMTFPIADQK